MKRIISLILIVAMAFCLASCEGKNIDIQGLSDVDLSDIDMSQIMSVIEGLIDVPGSSGSLPVSEPVVPIPEPEPMSEEDIKSNFDKANEYVKSLIDTSGMDFQADEEDPKYLYGSYYMSDERQVDLSDEFTVEGVPVVLWETKVKDLEGLEEFRVTKVDETVDPEVITSVTLENMSKATLLSLELNMTDGPLPVSELRVNGFTAGTNPLSYTFCGINENSTFDEVLKSIGIPNESINVNADQYSTTISLHYYDPAEDESDRDGTLEVTFAYNAEDNTTKISSVNYSQTSY